MDVSVEGPSTLPDVEKKLMNMDDFKSMNMPHFQAAMSDLCGKMAASGTTDVEFIGIALNLLFNPG